MNEFIKKLTNKLNELQDKWIDAYNDTHQQYADGISDGFGEAIEIVEQLAEEYNNTSTDDSISRSVLIDKLKKWKFANEERGYDTAKDLIQEMIDLVNEQQSYQSKGE